MSVSPSEKVLVAIEDGIATITINNPAANTWDLESLPALEAVVNNLNAMADVRALVITGQGEKFFSAGADLNQFASGDPVMRLVLPSRRSRITAVYQSQPLMGTPWAVVWKWPWPVTFALRSRTQHLLCLRLGLDCSLVQVVRSA